MNNAIGKFSIGAGITAVVDGLKYTIFTNTQ